VSANPTKGLQDNDIFDILVDSSGRTWFATGAGVARFNGTVADTAFDQNTGLTNPKCRALAEYNGKLWVATWGGGIGMCDLATDVWGFLNEELGLASDLVSDIDVYDDLLYFATNGGVNTYDDDDQLPMAQRWSLYSGDHVLGNFVSAVEVDVTPRGIERWYGPIGDDIARGDEEGRGIAVIRQSFPQPIHYTSSNSGIPEPRINDIFYDSAKDEFWIGFETKGLAKVDVSGSTWTIYTVGDGLPSELVHSITKVGDVIWVGTQNGIARQLPSGAFRGYGRAGGLPADRARVVYADSEGRLWVGFMEGGAALVDPASAE
jgi:ligand-binding sensor domain-containing protein